MKVMSRDTYNTIQKANPHAGRVKAGQNPLESTKRGKQAEGSGDPINREKEGEAELYR
jgi:hypothetical protein